MTTQRYTSRTTGISLSVCLCALVSGQFVVAQETGAPMSAIDWLSESVSDAAIVAPPTTSIVPDEPAVAATVGVPQVTVTPLDTNTGQALGLLAREVTGLPLDLWRHSDADTLNDLIAAQQIESLPAIQDLLRTLLLAEAEPPKPTNSTPDLFLARVDKLLDLGALEPALAMLERADTTDRNVFRRFFDVGLLTGQENKGCDILTARPDLAPTLPARIFCLARNGDWSAAALTLNTARVLGDVSDTDDQLLTLFLEPELAEEAAPLPPVFRVSPLSFRMRAAIGDGIGTASLPRAFAQADLRDTAGWKAQLDAVERLIRTQAIAPNTFFAVYTDHQPAASGGVWDRVEAVQRFDPAIRARDPNAVAATLPVAWSAMQKVHAERAFATTYADDLSGLPLGDASDLQFEIGLMSASYETIAVDAEPKSQQDWFMVAVATGRFDEVAAIGPLQIAIQAAFSGAKPAQVSQDLVANGQLGEALLRAIVQFNIGQQGETADVTQALALFRMVGLEATARRAALEILVLERRS